MVFPILECEKDEENDKLCEHCVLLFVVGLSSAGEGVSGRCEANVKCSLQLALLGSRQMSADSPSVLVRSIQKPFPR